MNRGVSGNGQDGNESVVQYGLMRVGEVEGFLGLSRAAIYRLMASGDLQFVTIGRSRRVPRQSVIALAARNLCAAVGGAGE